MNYIQSLKTALKVYHKRNDIINRPNNGYVEVDNIFCDLINNKIVGYSTDGSKTLDIINVHRKKFKSIWMEFFSNKGKEYKHYFSIGKDSNNIFVVLFNDHGNSFIRIPCNIDSDEYFNLSLNNDLIVPYEDLPIIEKMCSQINHDMRINLL